MTSMTPDAFSALQNAGFSRRGLLKGAGALIVSFTMGGGGPKLDAQTTGSIPTNQVDSWVAIAADGTVTAYSGKCDFGQGFRTVQQQLVSEELTVPLDRISMVICDTALTPDQGTSSGSQGHPTQFGTNALRQALATAREALLRLASEQWKVPLSELVLEDGVIRSKVSNFRRMRLGDVIYGRRLNLAINTRAVPKDPKDYKVLGTSVPRYDIPPKVTGEFTYVQHVRVPGMLHGRVVRPPTVGAKVISVDETSVQGLPGNVRVVVKRDFVGVVADKQWQAIQAAGALQVKWSEGTQLPEQAGLYDYMRKQPSRDSYTVVTDDVDRMFESAAKTVKATYFHPYQIHGSLGTSCAVADVKGSGAQATATVWSATQGIYPIRDSVAMVLGLPRDRVRAIYFEGSGCYGINAADTVTYDAAILSQAVGRPVRVQLSRQEEMTAGENYGPAYVIDLRAALDGQDRIVSWDYESWTLTKGGRPNANTPGNVISGALAGFATPALVPAPANRPNNFGNNGNAASSYGAGCVGTRCGGTGNIRSERVLVHTIASPFFTGPLRSPARLQNSFANESFIDEVAAAVRADPVQYRLRHLSDPRLIDVLNAAARAANWQTRPSPNPGNPRTGVATGRGVACVLYEGDNGYSALVAEVEVDQETGKIVVKRFVASGDSGPVSNPDGLRNQMEGGALQGMSRALHEEVTWSTDGTIRSSDWRRFNIYRFGDFMPKVETVLINRPDQEQMGAGETTITIVAAAMANAIFDATGARIRQVPFTQERVLAALKSRG
jgi:nicotinate dehydrogenase subunit B